MAVVAVGISMISFLVLYVSAGMPDALRPITIFVRLRSRIRAVSRFWLSWLGARSSRRRERLLRGREALGLRQKLALDAALFGLHFFGCGQLRADAIACGNQIGAGLR